MRKTILAAVTCGLLYGSQAVLACEYCASINLPLPGGGSAQQWICWFATVNGWSWCVETTNHSTCALWFACTGQQEPPNLTAASEAEDQDARNDAIFRQRETLDTDGVPWDGDWAVPRGCTAGGAVDRQEAASLELAYSI